MTSFPSGERDLARETAAEGEIARVSAGTGPALLFVHSGIADRRMWAPQVAAFARSFRCICLDLRGFGESGPQKRTRPIMMISPCSSTRSAPTAPS